MEFLQQAFNVRFEYKVYFTRYMFDPANEVFRSFLGSNNSAGYSQKILFVLDSNVARHHPHLTGQIKKYLASDKQVQVVDDMVIIPGGEEAKNNERYFYDIVSAINKYGIDRHSYLVAIGGGSVLDVAGYAAAVSHRGIRHIRIPTTVLSQNDSGVGVKNGINYFNKKNFLGTFAPPAAVFNDLQFLSTLDDADWRSGVSEAIKVALIKDAAFFQWLEEHVHHLVARDMELMHYLVKRCAQLHLEHISGGDPFEMGSSRPLDFGHWSAHKLEQLTDFTVRHGEAVAIGIALDSVYSHLCGKLSESALTRVLNLILAFGLDITHPLLHANENTLLQGLNEFREHLGGQLTIMLLRDIGKGEEVHEMDASLVVKAGKYKAESLKRKA